MTSGILFALTILFHISVVVWHNNSSWELKFMYECAVLGGFGALFGFANSYFESFKQRPLQALWTMFLLVSGVLLISAVFSIRFAKGEWEFFHRTDTDTFLGIVTICSLSLLQGLLGIGLFIQLRELILFKRTSSSVRNWYLLLGTVAMFLMVRFIENSFHVISPYLNVAWFFLIPLSLIVLNSFRLSWIVYLSFKDKLAAIGICIGLFFVLTLMSIDIAPAREGMVRGEPFIHVYSPNLYEFVRLSITFGILYTFTAFLSLVFHLPTTNDFKKKSLDLANLHSLAKFVGEVFDPEKLYQTVVTSALEDERKQIAWLALTNIRSGTLRPQIVATHRIDQEVLVQRVDVDALYEELKDEPLIISQALSDHRIDTKSLDYTIGSLVVLPLMARQERIGALFITKAISEGFEEDDIDTLTTIADQAALAIDNARLFEERIEKERLQRELAIAREVQRKLLPQFLPQIKGATLAASNEFAHEVGGDYYDVVSINPHVHNFIVADVSGKGTSAAFYMAELKGIYHSLSGRTTSPAELLAMANEALFARKEKNIFISAISAVLNSETEKLYIARAGHCPALTINLHGEARLLRKGGLGLGLAQGSLFAQTLQDEVIALQPGDVFLFYTDGVIDSRNNEGDNYGYDRLIAALKTYRQEDAQAIHDALIADIQAFTQGLGYYDDLTLVVLKWHGLKAPVQG